MPRSKRAARVGLATAAVAGTAAAASAAGSLAGAAYFARRVLTPDRRRPDDTVIREVRAETVVIEATDANVVPGRYGLWLQGGAGHVRIGDVVDGGAGEGWVERAVLGLDAGHLVPGPCRWNPYYFGLPPEESLGVPMRRVVVPSELGPLPAWLVPAGESARELGERWAVCVHGRGARREEAVRAMTPLRRSGLTTLVPCYRNDEGVPAGPDGRYNLGLSEWRDIDSAIAYAAEHGARDVTLVGWSMGGAISLQLLDRSPLAGVVSRLVLDAPVVDWGDVLAHQARLNRIPALVPPLARSMMGRSWGRRIVGVHESVDVARTDWVRRADELRTPTLLVHSLDDEFVPAGPSRRLAELRPDLVTFPDWRVARHTCEWNIDPARWEREVEDFVRARVLPGPPGGRSATG